MKIEAGKYYKTRDGRKVGPVREQNGYLTTNGWHYAENGECFYKGISGNEKQPEFDLISEWQEGPIRTVTRREIVPGVYGRIKITGTYQGNRVTMDWDRNDIITAAVPIVGMSAEELREAAHILNQVAETLEENGK